MKRFGSIAALAGVLALVGCDEGTAFNNLTVTLGDKTTVAFDLSNINAATTKKMVEGNKDAARLSERATREVSVLNAPLRDAATGLELSFQSYGVDSTDDWVKGSSSWSYGRTLYTLKNTSDKPIEIGEVTLMDGTIPLQKPQIVGNTDGAVIYGELPNNVFVWGAIEHPWRATPSPLAQMQASAFSPPRPPTPSRI